MMVAQAQVHTTALQFLSLAGNVDIGGGRLVTLHFRAFFERPATHRYSVTCSSQPHAGHRQESGGDRGVHLVRQAASDGCNRKFLSSISFSAEFRDFFTQFCHSKPLPSA